jgi:hypothetical protein
MMRTTDGRVICSSREDRRLLARAVLAQVAPHGLLAFRCADTHLHLLLACLRARAGKLACHVQGALTRRLDLACGFERAKIKPLNDQSHAYGSFRYILRQEQHHGIACDPLHDASNLPDLLGLRLLAPDCRANVGRVLPRISDDELRGYLDVMNAPRADTAATLCDAAAAALALPDLRGSDRQTIRARCALATLLPRQNAELARLWGTSVRSVQRARRQSADPALLATIERRIAMFDSARHG